MIDETKAKSWVKRQSETEMRKEEGGEGVDSGRKRVG